MIYDIVGGFAIWFLVLSIVGGALVIAFSIIAPLFMKYPVSSEQGRYVKITEKGYDFDTDY